MAKEITKAAASKAATVVQKYAMQESKKGLKKGAKATGAFASKQAKAVGSKISSLFKKK